MSMMKWADFCISKVAFDQNSNSIAMASVHVDNGETIGEVVSRNRSWLVQQAENGKSFCCIGKATDGKWRRLCDFRYEMGSFKWDAKLPQVLPKRKTFVSYYHRDDQSYRTLFENLFSDLVISKSVNDGDIDSDNRDGYIKQLVQKDFLSDVTILVVLVGPKTKCRKHVDWEIAGALNLKVGNSYAGLIGLLLPNHPDYGKKTYSSDNLPKRLAANLKSGYAKLYDWSDDRVIMQNRIEAAFDRRNDDEKIVNLSIPQMQNNTCE